MIMALARDRQLLKNCDISFHGIVDLDIARVDLFCQAHTYTTLVYRRPPVLLSRSRPAVGPDST